MRTTLGTPGVDGLADVAGVLRDWQDDTSPLQLHPGDLGWFWRFGAEATAAAVRVWGRGGAIAAVGLLDGPELLRLTVAPEMWRDAELARQVAADAAHPERGILPAGTVSVETPTGTAVQEAFSEVGWATGESWTPLTRDLTDPVPDPGVRVEIVRPATVADFTAVHRSAFGSGRFTDDRWRAMSTGVPFADARCLLLYDGHGAAVAGVTVWSAGAGRPGLIEPLGVHADHHGHGHGRAACLAAASALRELGGSSVQVCTPTARTAAVATYRSAGFRRLPERLDRTRADRG
ncbi:GNAT family N-acetyltransferase [Nakamurella endophytica]|nr:GNAT family N-acetyltransferase [Nakamurella endophytica]